MPMLKCRHDLPGHQPILILVFDPSSRGYKTFIMPNSTEHEISTAHKNKMLKI